jgi:hypothetical protein
MVRGPRFGQLSGRASNCAYRDSLSIYASSPNRPQITQIYADEGKTEPANVSYLGCLQDRRFGCRARQPKRLAYNEQTLLRSRASHVSAGASVDLDGFAFLDEKRHVDGLASFELCRLGDITGSITAKTFG